MDFNPSYLKSSKPIPHPLSLWYCFFSSSKGDSHAWVSAAPGSWEYRGKKFFYMTPMYRNYLFHPNHHVSTILVTQLHAIPLKNTDFLFIIGDGNAKVGSQEIPRGIGKFGLGVQNEAEQRQQNFAEKTQWSSKHPLPKTQEKTLHVDITRWSIPKSDWLYSLQPKMDKLYTVSKKKTRSWLWLKSWTLYCQIQT